MKGLKYVFFTFIISFITFTNVFAETCMYNGKIDGAEFEYKCYVSDNAISCSFVADANITYKKYENNNLSNSTSSRTYKMSKSDYYNSDGNIDCSLVSSIQMDVGITSLQEIQVFNVGENISCGIASSVSNSNYTYTGCPTFKLKNSGSTATDPGTSDDEEKIVFSTDNFCEGKVQGVFTTIGWVFFVLKILIPIILIVFGSIDFGKAMLSNKDDEIKKSAKTLVLRAIAGVIIFFIPTILGFIVSLFDKNNVYDGTFTDCTQCMLNPKHEFEDGSTCRKLVD